VRFAKGEQGDKKRVSVRGAELKTG
jgi:hypothetical protein